MLRRRFLFLMPVLAGIVVAGLAPPAQAAFRLRVESINASGNSTDGVVLSDSDGDGVIMFSGSVGTFSLNVTTGIKQPPNTISADAYGGIDLSNVSIATSSGGTLRITLEADGFTEGPDGQMIVKTEVGGTLGRGVSATFSGWADATNAMPILGDDDALTGAPLAIANPVIPVTGVQTPGLAFNTSPFSGASSAEFIKSGSYSLFSQAVIKFSGGGTVSFDQATLTTPAPGSLLLTLAATPVLGVGYLVRRRKSLAPAI